MGSKPFSWRMRRASRWALRSTCSAAERRSVAICTTASWGRGAAPANASSRRATYRRLLRLRHGLAVRAEVRTAAALDDALDRRPAGRAALPRAVVDEEEILAPFLDVGDGLVAVLVRERGAQRIADGARQPLRVRFRHRRAAPPRVQAGAVQRLGDRAVAESRKP